MFTLIQKKTQLTVLKIVFVIGVFTVLLYLPLFKAYFQQDEWFAFGSYYSQSGGLLHLLSTAFAPNIGHFTPFYYLSFYLLMAIFGSNYSAFLITSILWHIAIYFLFYFFSKKLFKNAKLALFVSGLFAIAASSQQATSWVVADTNTHGATFFGLVALFFAYKYIAEKEVTKFMICTVLAIFVSLFFKEVTVGLFASILTMPYLLGSSSRGKRIVTIGMTVFGGLYVLLRIVMLLLPRSVGSASLITQTQTLGMLAYNAITFPAKAFFQSFFSPQVWLFIGRSIGRILPHYWAVNTSQFSTAVNEKILEPLFIISFIIVVWYTLRRYKRDNKNVTSRIMVWSLLYVVVNSVIYAFSPERTGIITFLDSRNLYFVSIGSFIWFIALLSNGIRNSHKLVLTIFLALFCTQLVFIQSEFNQLIEIGSLRKEVINQIELKVPYLKPETVFLITSDTPYYGLSSDFSTPPFQSGFGHTLLVSYTGDRKYPSEFYSDTFLWPITSENYLSKDGVSFGYFRTYPSLLAAIKKYKISTENVYAFSWQGDTESIVDITDTIHSQITKDIKP